MCKFILVYAFTLRYNVYMKPLRKIQPKWSQKLAYAVGLLATDGNLSSDGRHIVFVSKDIKLIKTFKKCLKLTTKVSTKKSGFSPINSCYFVQFGDVVLYKFLVKIGIHPRKSKTIGIIQVPDKYFFDFLRGLFDGDGAFYAYWDKRWRASFMFYLVFISASKKHIEWLRHKINSLLHIKGHLNATFLTRTYQLRYAKRESLVLFKYLYHDPSSPCLERKRLKVQKALGIIGKHI